MSSVFDRPDTDPTMRDITVELAKIVDARKERLPAARAQLEDWTKAGGILDQLTTMVSFLPPEVAEGQEVKRASLELVSPTLRRDLATTVESFRAVVRRFARDNVTIAASGEARVGKSTLLQSITGLDDEQLPAASGARVTAARSIIYHSATAQRATLALHSFESFRQQVLRLYHVELNILPVPATADEFTRYQYPKATDLAKDETQRHRAAALLKRLTDMQTSFQSYRDLLLGTELDIEIADIRKYITYPDEVAGGSVVPDRQYLAVRELRIHTPFPHAQVDRLAVIDLPGLGEVAAEAHRHHMEALRDDVDLVLLVKRASQGLALWRTEDEQNLDLLDEARGAVTSRRDFVFIVINGGPDDGQLLDTVRIEVDKGANLGKEGLSFIVLEADVRDQRDVFDDVLRPILRHLTDRLHVMDKDVAASAQKNAALLARRTFDRLGQMDAAVVAATRHTASIRTDLDRRAEDVRLAIGRDLVALTKRLRARADDPDDVDQGLRDMVRDVCSDLELWAGSGMNDVDRMHWEAAVAARMDGGGESSGVASHEFDAARVQVARKYAAIDDYLNDVNIAELLDEITTILTRHLGSNLVEFESGLDPDADVTDSSNDRSREILKRFAKALEELPEACPTLAAAVRELCRLRFEFRSMVYPHIRSELDLLRQEARNPATGDVEPQILVSQSEEGAHQMYDFISRRTRQVAYRIRNTITDGAAKPAPVLLAAAEIFTDTFIRSPRAAEEFRTLAHGYRDEIWPDEYDGVDAADARVARLRNLIQDAQDRFRRLAAE